jgi:7-carboxy-7-deazaguanine synthase
MSPVIPLIPIAEVFGPTIQGEGDLAGHSTYFLRVGGCDFSCRWCDSAHAVLAEQVRELPRWTPKEIIDNLTAYRRLHPGPQWLTISGGNPVLYDLQSVVVAWKLVDHGKVAVETQGSRWKGWLADVDLLTISPKPPSSGMANSSDFKVFMSEVDHALSANGGQASGLCAVLKVVVFDDRDYEFAQRVHRMYPDTPFYLSCGTASGGLDGRWAPPALPEGYFANYDKFKQIRERQPMNWTSSAYTDTELTLLERYRWLAERVMADPEMADVAALPQLHALLWGPTTKGV